MRKPRVAPISQPKPEDKQKYFILDEAATSIAGQRIVKGQESIMLTDAEASFYVAGGAIGTEAAKGKKPEGDVEPSADEAKPKLPEAPIAQKTEADQHGA